MKLSIKKKFLIFLILSLPFSLWVGNRGATNDTQTYFNIFKNINMFDLFNPKNFYYETGVEIGYGWYSYLISIFSSSSLVLFLIFSLLSFFLIYQIAEKMKVSYFPVFLLYVSSAYFVMQQFMQMRQGLAIPLALFALTILIKSNKISLVFILLVCLAISFHQTAIAVILLGYFFYFIIKKIRLSLLYYRFLLIFIIIIFLFLSKFILGDVLISISGRLTAYSNTSYAEDIGLLRLPNIKAILVFFMIYVLMTENIIKNNTFKVFMCLFAIAIVFRIGFSDFTILSGRFSTAFSHVEIFLLPYIFERFGKFIGSALLFIYVLIQAITVYMFQAPYVFESYYLPLY